MRAFNLHTATYDYPADNPEGYRRGHARVGEAIGSQRIGGHGLRAADGRERLALPLRASATRSG